MRLANLALPLFVLSVTGVAIAALALVPAPQTQPEIAPPEPSANIARAKPIEESNARDVGGGSVPTPVLPNMALERIAPAPGTQQLEAFGPPKPPLTEDQPYLLFQPFVENAGTLIAEGRTITLKHVVAVNAGQMCDTADGGQWPCGMKSRTALRALVRGRAISCLLPDQQKTAVETECRIGKENLGEWLVEQGWAAPKPGSDLESLGRAAKLMGRGIYGKGS